MLAAFLSQIGQALPDIPDLVRAKLYDICPETVPHFWSASSVAEFIVKYAQIPRFCFHAPWFCVHGRCCCIRRVGRLKQQRPKVFEDTMGGETNINAAYDAYLKLVERYMWTFAALCLPHASQAGRIPPMLSADDAWRWLALTINACERYSWLFACLLLGCLLADAMLNSLLDFAERLRTTLLGCWSHF